MSNNHLTSYYKLPFPIRQYNIFEREQYGFDDYKKLVTNNLKFSTKTVVNKTETINNYYEKYCNKNSRIIRLIIDYLLDNISKVKIMDSLEPVEFGIGISERFGTIEFIYPTCIHFDDTNLYTNYNEDEFYNMRVFEKLEWLRGNCEFIPVCILKEDFEDGESHKYSHIKKSKYAIDIKRYVDKLEYPPADNNYYFIKYDKNNKYYYLKSDCNLSPKSSI